MASPHPYQAMLAEHRRRLARLAEHRALAPVKKLYDEAHARLEGQLARAARGSWTAHSKRLALMQIHAGQKDLARRVMGDLTASTREARTESMRAVVENVVRMEKRYRGAEVVVPLEEAARFRGVFGQRESSLLIQHRESVARHTAERILAMENELSLGLLTGEGPSETIGRIQEVAEGTWYQAERIVRTEVAYAYNVAARDAIADAAEALPELELWARWNENVDDFTYEPLDDRVGDDSLAMHGQVAPAGGEFTMPPTTRDGTPVGSLAGQTWSAPPSRPNGREVLSPWSPLWGDVPGWIWRGRRVPATARLVSAA